jgi:hypothetical protein
MSRKHHVFSNESDTICVADDVISVADDTLRIADHELRGGRKPAGSESVNAYRTNSGLINGSARKTIPPAFGGACGKSCGGAASDYRAWFSA